MIHFLLLPESWDTSGKILPELPHTGSREHIPDPHYPGILSTHHSTIELHTSGYLVLTNNIKNYRCEVG